MPEVGSVLRFGEGGGVESAALPEWDRERIRTARVRRRRWCIFGGFGEDYLFAFGDEKQPTGQ